MTAGEDISMMDEKEHHETIHEYHSHVSGLLSSKTKDLYEAGTTDTVRGSLISGNETRMESGRDMTITGSAVISSKDTTLLAGRNFKADSTEERSGSTYRESVKKRGLLSGGGLGFTMGSEKRKDRYDSEAVEQVGSTIGSVEGSIHIIGLLWKAWIGYEKVHGAKFCFWNDRNTFRSGMFLLGSETLGYISIFFFMLSGIVNTN